MYMKLINTEEVIEDGVLFIKKTYSNGIRKAVVKTQKSDENATVVEPEPIPLSEQEQIVIDTALNVEYMTCLLEASLT